MMTMLKGAFILLFAACAQANGKPIEIALPAHFQPQALVAADFNGDGRVDIALCGQDGRLAIFSAGQLATKDASCGANPSQMIAADLDGDKRIDIAIANHDTDYITVLHNDGNAHFTARTLHVHSKPHPHTVAAADVNEDGRIDLITDSWGENRLTLLLADGRGGWQSPGTPIDIGRKPYIIAIAADIDGDGHIDLVVSNSGFDTVSILFGDGRGGFRHAEQSPIVAGPTPFEVAVADVNGDGRPDILIANYSGHMSDTSRDGVTWIRNDGRRHFTAFPQPLAIARGCWHIAAGDFNGDRFADAAFVDIGSEAIKILYGSASGPRPGPTIPLSHEPHHVAIANRRIFVINEDRDVLQIVTFSSKSSFSLVQPVIVASPLD